MKKVLLTGITGYIGNHCALELLKAGYAVKGSVRDMSKAETIKEMLSKEIDADGKLEFCVLDLLKDEGWQEAMQGCEYVLHVASPFVMHEPKDENLYIKPAVEGTLRALKTAQKAGVKRIVITSSIVAMLGDADKSIALNTNAWTNVNAKNISAYAKSKTLAEQSAWDYMQNQAKESSMELTVINPGPVYGPSLSGNLSGASMDMFSQMLSGKMPMVPNSAMNMSDVRDVAKIHVLALENAEAAGKRFIVTTNEPHSFQSIAQILKDNGYDKVSTKIAPNFLLYFLGHFNRELKSMRAFIGKTYTADITPAKEVFNWNPINLDKTILDTAVSIQAHSQQ